MNSREILMLHCPLRFDDVVIAYGKIPDLMQDAERAAFFAVWALLTREWADTMLWEVAPVTERKRGGEVSGG